MTNHAVVIGINNYPGISSLNGPCNDAHAFIRWVTYPGPGGIAQENVHKLLSKNFHTPPTAPQNAKPVSDEINAVFEELIGNNPTQHVGDRLYVFVAGHGMSDVNRAESVAVIAANATRTGVTLPHVVVTDWVNYFRRNYTFKEIVLVMDCCQDANVLRPLNTTGFLQSNPHPRANKVRVFQANATVWTKKSYEKKFNGKTRGIFSVAFMDALEKAPTEHNGKVTGKVIKNYIDQHIKTIAGDKEIEDPFIHGREYEKIVFYQRNEDQETHAATTITLVINIDNAAGGEVIDLFNGDRELISSKTATGKTVTFQAAAGLYKVALRGTNRQALMEVIQNHEHTL